MSRWSAFRQIILSRLREFYREPAAIFWVYGFPVLLAVGLGIAFANRPPESPHVDVVTSAHSGELAAKLREANIVAEEHDLEECRHRYWTGKTSLYVIFDGQKAEFGLDPTRSESASARYQVEAAIRRWKSPDVVSVDERVETERGNRYIDFLIPGLLGMNLMGGGMWGVGFVIVDMRVRKLLKRLLATPMRRADFLVGMLTARTILLLPEILALTLIGHYLFGVPIRGNLVAFVAVVFAGAFAFSGIGMLIASRTEKIETISGLMQLVMLPMWLLGGIFFSAKRFPDAAQPFIQAVPLTQINDALREVMLEGKSLAEIWWRLAILAAYGMVTFAIGLKFFRWK